MEEHINSPLLRRDGCESEGDDGLLVKHRPTLAKRIAWFH